MKLVPLHEDSEHSLSLCGHVPRKGRKIIKDEYHVQASKSLSTLFKYIVVLCKHIWDVAC